MSLAQVSIPSFRYDSYGLLLTLPPLPPLTPFCPLKSEALKVTFLVVNIWKYIEISNHYGVPQELTWCWRSTVLEKQTNS